MRTKRPRRLDGVNYVAYQRYFVTMCTARRKPLFTTADLVEEIHRELQNTAQHFDFEILAYCFMPDHVHCLLSATSDAADFKECARRFKQLTGYRFRQKQNERLWQPGYYEHIVRDNESSEAIVRYILENPIRAGLTRELGEYPFAGSELYTGEELVTAWDREGLGQGRT